MLTGLGVELDFVTDGTTRALEKQVGAFTAGESAFWALKSCHLNFLFDHLALKTGEPMC
jgi:hypothetical protein